MAGPTESFHAFKTISSDDVIWDVYFNLKTGHPQYAIAEASQTETSYIIIPPGNYRARPNGFEQEEFMPKQCYEQRQSQYVEGPIIPLSDFGLIY